MILEVALGLAIAKSQPSMPPHQVKQYSTVIAEESRKKHLDPWVFYAIVHSESRFVSSAINHNPNGDCAVGIAQILVKNCEKEKVAVLLDPVTNLRRSAFIQQAAMKWCKSHSCKHGWLMLYNNSREYVSLVRNLAKETRRDYFTNKPAVVRAPRSMHAR